MELKTAITLIKAGILVTTLPQIWADLGAGSGLFTEALSTLIPPGSTIYSVDKDASALSRINIPPRDVTLKAVVADFVRDQLAPEPLDGILMANALHFVKKKFEFMERVKSTLKSAGRLLIIEYNRETGNPWVPYPISYRQLQELANDTGFKAIRMIGSTPSKYDRQARIYAAVLSIA